MPKGSVILIGNYLSSPRHNRNIWQDLAEKLADNDWDVITTSSRENQLLRLIDMLTTILREQSHYSIAQIDVFSGPAFIFAEMCACLLRMLKKPFVITLHGGRLPEFARINQARVRKLLNLADICVTPSPFLQQALAHYRSDIRLVPNPVEVSSIHIPGKVSCRTQAGLDPRFSRDIQSRIGSGCTLFGHGPAIPVPSSP